MSHKLYVNGNEPSNISIEGGTFRNNKALESGGAIALWGAPGLVTVTGGLFENNQARYDLIQTDIVVFLRLWSLRLAVASALRAQHGVSLLCGRCVLMYGVYIRGEGVYIYVENRGRGGWNLFINDLSLYGGPSIRYTQKSKHFPTFMKYVWFYLPWYSVIVWIN